MLQVDLYIKISRIPLICDSWCFMVFIYVFLKRCLFVCFFINSGADCLSSPFTFSWATEMENVAKHSTIAIRKLGGGRNPKVN